MMSCWYDMTPPPIHTVTTVLFAGLLFCHGAHAEFDYDQKLSLQNTYIDYQTLRPSSDGSFQLKYEGFANWGHPDGAWPDYSFFLRPWLSYRSDEPVPFLSQEPDTSAQVEGAFAELWEFKATRHRLLGNPAMSLSAGRQQFSGDYGFWWDDSLESVKLNLSDSRKRGFVALASRQYLYNTDDNEPAANQKDITYLLSEYHYRWAASQWIGIRLLGETDQSAADEADDETDFDGVTIGLQFEGEEVLRGPLDLDYHLEFAGVHGAFDNISTAQFAGQTVDTRGWLAFTEFGHSFDRSSNIARLALRMALTDSPDTPYSGFFQNAIQSSRASRFSEHSTGLSGSIINLRMTNLMMAGVLSQHQLTARSNVQLSLYDLRRRNTDIAARRTIGLDYAESDGQHLGNVAEAQYLWAMFPYALKNEHLTFDVLVTMSYFQGGDALQDDIKDYRFSLDMNLRY